MEETSGRATETDVHLMQFTDFNWQNNIYKNIIQEDDGAGKRHRQVAPDPQDLDFTDVQETVKQKRATIQILNM